MSVSTNFYDILLVARDATTEDIKKAYRKACLKHHPDKGGDEEMFKEVTIAWETLGDEDKRHAYDQKFRNTVHRVNSKEKRSAYETRSRQVSKTQTFAPQAPPQNAPQQQWTHDKVQADTTIPDDLASLTIKEVKELLTALGVRHDDCVEKSDLIARLESRRRPTNRYKDKENITPGCSFPNNSVRIKVITIGSAGAGKSCLIKRYCEGRFVNRYITTIGVDYGVKAIANVLRHQCKVNFFDLSGQEDFKDIRLDFYRDAQGVLLCFDSTNQSSFQSLSQWMFESRVNGLDLEETNVVVALCATKIDAPGRQVTRADGQAFAQSKGFLYFEVSSQTGDNVHETLNSVFEHVVGKQLEARKKAGL